MPATSRLKAMSLLIPALKSTQVRSCRKAGIELGVGVRQDDGDDAELLLLAHGPHQGDLHFLVMPRPVPRRTEEDGDGGTALQRVGEFGLPLVAGDEMPFVEERPQLRLADQPLGDLLDLRLVLAVVREEDVEVRRRSHGESSI